MYQQSTNFLMPISLDGIDLTDVESIEIMFKQERSPAAKPLKTALWRADGTGSATTDPETENGILVPWTMEETYYFAPEREFYLHARIWLVGTTMNPPVPILPLTMDMSLFARDEVVSA